MENQSKAVWHSLASALSFAAMSVFVKLAVDVGVFEKVVFRNLVTLVVASAVVLGNGRPSLGEWRNQGYLTARSLLGIGGVVCYFWAIENLLLADAVMLAKLSPFFVSIFAAFFLRERLHGRIAVALVLGFAGGIMVVKPQFDLEILPALAAVASAVFAGGAYVLLRFLRNREPPEIIVLHFSLVTVVGLLPFVLPHFECPSSTDWIWLVGIGLTAASGQLSLTAAYRHAPAGKVSLISYATIVFSAIFGWLIWAEMPGTLSFVGGILILAGAVVAFAPAGTERSSA